MPRSDHDDLKGGGIAARPTPTERVDHPAHYGGESNPYEAIKVIEAWSLGFSLGNCVKYIARHLARDRPLEDLKKARWYLDRAIANLEEARRRAPIAGPKS